MDGVDAVDKQDAPELEVAWGVTQCFKVSFVCF